jgi:hypothetical protein
MKEYKREYHLFSLCGFTVDFAQDIKAREHQGAPDAVAKIFICNTQAVQ